MRGVVCYPIKSLVRYFVPEQYEYVCVKNDVDLIETIHEYQPDFCMFFSESFTSPVWEWLPSLVQKLPTDIPIILVPFHRDQSLIEEIVRVKKITNIYVLSPGLTHQQIKTELLRIHDTKKSIGTDQEIMNSRENRIYSLMSPGGAGLTNFCINYPLFLARQNRHLLIGVVDMNLYKPDLSLFFHLNGYEIARYRPDLNGLDSSNKEGRDLKQWLQIFARSEYEPNVYYSSAAAQFSSQEISSLFFILSKIFDVVLIDWGNPMIQMEAAKQGVLLSNKTIFFSRPELFSLKNVDRIVKTLDLPDEKVGLMVSPYHEAEMSKVSMKDLAGIKVEGTLPRIESSRIHQAFQNGSILINEMFPPKAYLQSFKKCSIGTNLNLSGVIAR
ncbi:hypothetical protein [Brevibacillus daliensis]|uniref:hypothetical protein n=1 Tax=Brevibacillus daliensis TaxID=2892995 RepID=UPI001E50AEB3|nr:hypothetical protein [Brevibacillus daliensis]